MEGERREGRREREERRATIALLCHSFLMDTIMAL